MFNFMTEQGKVFMTGKAETGRGERAPDILRGQRQRIEAQRDGAAGPEHLFPYGQDA